MNANNQGELPASLDAPNQEPENQVDECVKNLEKKFRDEVKAQQFKYHKNLLIFASIFLIVLVGVVFLSLWFIDIETVTAMNNANASADKDVDYLKFVVPVLLTMGAFFAAVLGFNRLKDFDDRIAKLGEDLRTELKDERDLQQEAIAAFRAEISEDKKRQNDARERFECNLESKLTEEGKVQQEFIDRKIKAETRITVEEIKEAVEKTIVEAKKDIKNYGEKKTQDFKDGIESYLEESKKFEEKFKWLGELTESEREKTITEIDTVYDANNQIENYHFENERPKNTQQNIKRIVKMVIDNDLDGDSDDYFNLAVELARWNLYSLSCSVCEKGANKFKKCVDLWAALLQFASKNGEYAKVETAIKELQSIPKRIWNWRAFGFLIDYYISVNDVDKAEEIAKEYKLYLPYEERAYERSAKIVRLRTGGKEGEDRQIEELRTPIEMGINSPICANRLAEIYEIKCDYEKALMYIDLAIRCNIEEQASVNSSFLYYTRARIYDKIFSEDTQREGAKLYAQNAVADYETAINIGRLSQNTERLANQRKAILKKHLPEDDGADAKLMYVLHKAASKTGKELEEFIEWALDDDK